MSTELKTLKGQFFSKGGIKNTEMSVTRFSGGKEGMKVQFTLSTFDQDEFFTHISLDRDEIKTLISELLKVL